MNPRLRPEGKNWLTLSLVPGQKVYGERLITEGKNVWREWNPFRSKLAAGLCSGLKELPIEEGNIVLYLGSAEGTTVSHVSDLVGEGGLVVGVDVSPKAMVTFAGLVESRSNILPVLGDASMPEDYAKELGEFSADVIVQDVSQKNQAEIFVRNMEALGKKGTQGLLVIKSRSVDFSKPPEQVLAAELKIIKKHYSVLQIVNLNLFEKGHFLIHCRKG